MNSAYYEAEHNLLRAALNLCAMRMVPAQTETPESMDQELVLGDYLLDTARKLVEAAE